MPERDGQALEPDVLWDEYRQLRGNPESVTPERMGEFLRKLKLDPVLAEVHEQAFLKMWTGKGESLGEWGSIFDKAEKDPAFARKTLVDISKRLCKAYGIRPLPVYFDKLSPEKKAGNITVPAGRYAGILLCTWNEQEGIRLRRSERKPHIVLWEHTQSTDGQTANIAFISKLAAIVHETAHYFQQELQLNPQGFDPRLSSSAMRLSVVSRIETDILFHKFPKIPSLATIYGDNPKEIDAYQTDRFIDKIYGLYGFLHGEQEIADARRVAIGNPIPPGRLQRVFAAVRKTSLYRTAHNGAAALWTALKKFPTAIRAMGKSKRQGLNSLEL
jgi:hypothetical protein